MRDRAWWKGRANSDEAGQASLSRLLSAERVKVRDRLDVSFDSTDSVDDDYIMTVLGDLPHWSVIRIGLVPSPGQLLVSSVQCSRLPRQLTTFKLSISSDGKRNSLSSCSP